MTALSTAVWIFIAVLGTDQGAATTVPMASKDACINALRHMANDIHWVTTQESRCVNVETGEIIVAHIYGKD